MNCAALQQRHVSLFPRRLRFILLWACCMVVGFAFTIASSAGQSKPAAPHGAITLDAPTGWDLQEHAFDTYGNRLPEAPASFRRFGEVKAGEVGGLHTLTLRFAESVSLTHIKSTPDFPIEKGGSCMEGGKYEANTTCTLLVRFTPQGPGNRLGHLVVSHSGSATPSAFGLGGNGYSPVINFIPSVITTLPGTYPSSVGLLSGAQNLAIDGSDSLYVADTGNNVIRYADSSGTFKTLASSLSGPLGITVDNFGEVYFSEPKANLLYEIWEYGLLVDITGTGTGTCTIAAPCAVTSEAMTQPGQMSIDHYNNIFFAEGKEGAGRMVALPYPPEFGELFDPFTYQESQPDAFAVDAEDNLYSYWNNGDLCAIITQSFYNAETSTQVYQKVVGGRLCGFSGDGSQAGNAEIGTSIGQIWFDAAGNMYFSDTSNQRVRRVDYTTGIIHTIAGNGTAGYTGDGGSAKAAELSGPTGVAVNSQGAVYIISSAASGQVIRQVGPQGFLTFANQGKGSASAAQLVTVTNTGNSTMVLTNVAITGANAGDFKVDNTTTNCILTPGATLYAGQTCKIGVIFTPAAVGARSATLTLLGNTVNGADSVTLSGTGVLPAATFKITAPANGASFPSGTAVTFSVSVTSPSGAKPTGTVQFKVDGANYGSAVTLSSTGTASTSVTGLTTKSHVLSATYSGDSNYAPGGPISVTINVTAAVKVTFISAMTEQLFSPRTAVPLAVMVTASSGPAPTGTVKFSVDGNPVGSATIVAGKASVNSGILAAGSHTVVAAYSGDKYHPAAKASEKISVSP
jgi:hypothetical protein